MTMPTRNNFLVETSSSLEAGLRSLGHVLAVGLA